MTGNELGWSVRRLRARAGITQEELADRAGISARTVSDVERGLRTALHRDTAQRLASALGLRDEDRTRFEAVARGRHGGAEPDIAPSPIPTPPTRLLGRTGELAAVVEGLRDPGVRLLTLTGPGGIGKTRLALEAASRVRAQFGDGVFFVALGELTDASLVKPELAKAIGVVETGQELTRLLTERLAGGRVLVVLDTFEHLVPAVPVVYDLIQACPGTTFLVTSRSALRLRGEHVFPVPPLRLPSADRAVRPGDIDLWPATALFWERARAVRPDLTIDAETAALVGGICRKLDGLPLAIELAAARVRHLPLAAIRDQLEHRLRLLVGGALDLPVRQRAIRDTVGWSHDLLAAPDKALLRRLSVFAGGWDLDAVPPVVGQLDDAGAALDGISTLVDHSLVVPRHDRRRPRYDMLDVVAEYAAARLVEAGEKDATERRHALHYLALAEATEPHLVRAGRGDWFRRLDADRGNLRRGMGWTIDNGETGPALRYAVALWRYWRQLGEFVEGRHWTEAALAVAGESPPSLRAKALWAASALAFPQADHARMAELAGEATELAHRSDDPMDLRNALTIHGMVAMCQGRYADALVPYARCVDIARARGMSWQLATSHLNLGTALLHAGRVDEAVVSLEEALRAYRELGDDVFAARVLNHLAQAALVRDDIDGADRLGRPALAEVAAQRERQGIAEGLEIMAAVAAGRGHVERAAVLAGAAATIRRAIAARAVTFDTAITGRLVAAAERGAGRSRWARAWQRGAALDPVDAVAYALGPSTGQPTADSEQD